MPETKKKKERTLSPRYMAARVLLQLLDSVTAETTESLSTTFDRKVLAKKRQQMLDHFQRLTKTVRNRAQKHKDNWENPTPSASKGKPFPGRAGKKGGAS